MTNIYSKISYLRFIIKITATEIIKIFQKWIEKYGKLRTIVSDNGLRYRSSLVQKYLQGLNIELRYKPAYTPESNRISKRISSTF